MTKRIAKLTLSRETLRRIGDVTRAVEAWSVPRCNTDDYTYCTPCPESVATPGCNPG